jgi:hypothetical protein
LRFADNNHHPITPINPINPSTHQPINTSTPQHLNPITINPITIYNADFTETACLSTDLFGQYA